MLIISGGMEVSRLIKAFDLLISLLNRLGLFTSLMAENNRNILKHKRFDAAIGPYGNNFECYLD